MAPQSFISILYYTLFPIVVRGTGRGHASLTTEEANNLDFEDFVAWESRDSMKNEPWSTRLRDAGWPLKRIFTAWKLQRDMTIEHIKFLDGDDDIQVFKKMLLKCRNLSSIHLSVNGVGGAEKLRKNGKQDYFTCLNPSYRVDGRQLFAVLSAASIAASSTASNMGSRFATIRSLTMAKGFWEQDDSTFTGSRRRHYGEDFISMASPTMIKTAMPFLRELKRLTLSLLNRTRGVEEGTVGERLELFLANSPHLEYLTLTNPDQSSIDISTALRTASTSSLRTLKFQSCMFTLDSIQKLSRSNAETLKSVHLEDIGLLAGNLRDLFTFLREAMDLREIHLEGYLVEFQDDQCFYFRDEIEEDDKDEFDDKERQRSRAREAIEAFVSRQRNTFPLELVDQAPVETGKTLDTQVNAVIGAWKLYVEDDFF